jgi:hypothetical protein
VVTIRRHLRFIEAVLYRQIPICIRDSKLLKFSRRIKNINLQSNILFEMKSCDQWISRNSRICVYTLCWWFAFRAAENTKEFNIVRAPRHEKSSEPWIMCMQNTGISLHESTRTFYKNYGSDGIHRAAVKYILPDNQFNVTKTVVTYIWLFFIAALPFISLTGKSKVQFISSKIYILHNTRRIYIT